MSATDDLIARLAGEGAAPRGGIAREWALYPALAGLAALAILALILGPPLTALPGIGAAPYVIKTGFPFAVLVLAGLALNAAAHPARPWRWRAAWLALPFLAAGALAAMEIAATDPVFPGATWTRCLAAIALLTPLGFVAAMAVLRRLAPTALRAAGALAGIFAGALAATAYSLWCPEVTATFLFAWYAMPILAAGIVGALLGPRLLRW